MHIRIFLFICFLFFHCESKINAQVLLSADQISLEGLDRINPNFGIKSSNLKKKVSLKKFCPTPGNQGKTGSCASFAAVHGALNISNSIHNNLIDERKIDSIILSSSFVYNQLNQSDNCSKGTSIVKTLDFLVETGTCFESEFPFTDDCTILPEENLLKNKANLQIEYSAILFDNKSSDIRKENLIKSYLNDSIPVIVVCQISDNFLNVRYGTSFWERDERRDHYLGHHVMVIVGYDDHTESFELLNSWGQNWANEGFVQISYKDLTTISTSGLILKVNPKCAEEVGNRIKSTFSDTNFFNDLFKPASKQYISFSLKAERIRESGNVLIRNQISLKDNLEDNENVFFDVNTEEFFQLELSDLGCDNYFYVFSVNENEIKQHWPRNSSSKETNLNLSTSSSITVPNEETALLLNSLNEKIVIFGSNFEISGSPDSIYNYALNNTFKDEKVKLDKNIVTMSAHVHKKDEVILTAILKPFNK